jgi:hypothetical protein
MLEVRKGRFFKRAKSALVKKRSALRRMKSRIERKMVEKMSKPK